MKNENKYMQMALKSAYKGVGQVSPNPLVGCVIVKEGKIVGQGFHQKYGGAHAEINALNQAKNETKGAQMYITLEPCCHYGKTPPCTEAILQAGIKKVYIAMPDPNPLVAGRGINFLTENGIEVALGIEAKKAKKLNEKFIHFISQKIPFVALKIATTANGKITRSDGKKWITNKESRLKVHQLRNEYDAILIGKKTAENDDPSLTTYLLKNGNDPTRVVLDSNLVLSEDQRIFADGNFIVVTTEGKSDQDKQKYFKKGGKILECGKEKVDLNLMLIRLGEMNLASLFVEGGKEVYESFLAQNLVQKVYWFKAPFETGGEALGVEAVLEEIQRKALDASQEFFDKDLLQTIYLKP